MYMMYAKYKFHQNLYLAYIIYMSTKIDCDKNIFSIYNIFHLRLGKNNILKYIMAPGLGAFEVFL